MTVTLVAITRPVMEAVNTPGDLIAFCARVSNPANQRNSETAPKLLRYLVDKHHWSPFEMAHMVLGITTTRDVAHQLLRHRSFSFQEFSQRYAAVTAPPVLSRARLQDATNRQASHETDDEQLQGWWHTAQQNAAQFTALTYQHALDRGIAKEVARKVLPEGLTTTTLYMAGTIRSWIHYVQERTSPSTQREHRDIATACKAILLREFHALAEVLA